MIITPAKGLVFVPQNHTYWVDDVEVPSVTTVMKRSDVYSDYSMVPPHILERAASIGITTHKAVENWINKGTLLTTDDESANVYLDGFVLFLRENDFEPLYAEIKLYDPVLWYAGTIDLVCRVNGTLYICDIKTTNKLNKEAIELQLAAYLNLIGISSRNDRISDRAVIWLKKDGTYKFHRATDPTAFRRFKALL